MPQQPTRNAEYLPNIHLCGAWTVPLLSSSCVQIHFCQQGIDMCCMCHSAFSMCWNVLHQHLHVTSCVCLLQGCGVSGTQGIACLVQTGPWDVNLLQRQAVSVKFVSEMFKQGLHLNGCHVGEVMHLVANSQSHQKSVLRNKYAAARGIYTRISLLATCMSSLGQSLHQCIRLSVLSCDRFSSILKHILAHGTCSSLWCYISSTSAAEADCKAESCLLFNNDHLMLVWPMDQDTLNYRALFTVWTSHRHMVWLQAVNACHAD